MTALNGPWITCHTQIPVFILQEAMWRL